MTYNMDYTWLQAYDLFVHSRLFYLFVFTFGAAVGSFSGVCIARISVGRSVIFPRSHCQCGKTIPLWWNVPIISWLMLRGRARCCGARIGIAYIGIELLVAVLFTVLWHVTQSSLFIPGAILFVILVISSGIDFNTMVIPDLLTVGGATMGIIIGGIFSRFVWRDCLFLGIENSAKGLLIGSSLLMWGAMVSEILLRKETIGFGDVKLIGCIGAFSGTNCAIFSIFGGALIGLFVILPFWAMRCRSHSGRIGMGQPLPFGPFLAVGAICYWLFFREVVDDNLAKMSLLLA
ncbi:MAG: prepilin peptidase [Puniceicoccales bacterium]|jgi:leader peptidase (prepilin peptidase)/N-methyltransferase|nr:prepilin peptidase [Puniceicoccales bacterium]